MLFPEQYFEPKWLIYNEVTQVLLISICLSRNVIIWHHLDRLLSVPCEFLYVCVYMYIFIYIFLYIHKHTRIYMYLAKAF